MHYVTNKELTAEIVECQQTMIVSDRLCRMLIMMVERIAHKPNRRRYSFLDDMRAEAIAQLVKCNTKGDDRRPNVLKFSLEYSERAGTAPNPFSYVTQIVSNVYRRFVKLEQGIVNFRDDAMIMVGIAPSARRQFEDEMARSSEPIPIKKRPGGPGRRRKSGVK